MTLIHIWRAHGAHARGCCNRSEGGEVAQVFAAHKGMRLPAQLLWSCTSYKQSHTLLSPVASIWVDCESIFPVGIGPCALRLLPSYRVVYCLAPLAIVSCVLLPCASRHRIVCSIALRLIVLSCLSGAFPFLFYSFSIHFLFCINIHILFCLQIQWDARGRRP